MGDRWDYRSVEGALYRLGQPAEARLERRSLSVPLSHSSPGPRGPAPEIVDRVDFDLSVRRALDADEVQDVRDHYILGVRRHGYKRRATIIKKLVSRLNAGGET